MTTTMDERIATRRRGSAPQSQYISVWMREKDVDRLEQAAENAGVARSEAVRQGIKRWVAEQEAQAGQERR